MATVHRAEFEWIGGYIDGEGKLLSTQLRPGSQSSR